MSRIGYVMTTYFAVMLIGVLSIISFAPKLIWNASASTPIGLYAISASDGLEATDLVAVAAPEPIATFLADMTFHRQSMPSPVGALTLIASRLARLVRDWPERDRAKEKRRNGGAVLHAICSGRRRHWASSH